MTSGIKSQDLSKLGDLLSMCNRCPGDGVVFLDNEARRSGNMLLTENPSSHSVVIETNHC